MVPVRDKEHFEPQPWDGSENVLPGVCANGGYFLKADAGPKFVAGGTVVRPLATRRESGGKFSVFLYGGVVVASWQGVGRCHDAVCNHSSCDLGGRWRVGSSSGRKPSTCGRGGDGFHPS
jgi:hypothetical protein